MILKLLTKQNIIRKHLYCTKIANKNKVYTNTIFLPKTNFPLRLESQKLIERDAAISKAAEFDNLYKWQRGHLSEPEFVLHDGPPYANGKLHMGHAINKILKDTILRYQLLKGNKVHYVPGWDCHGLPIELKAITKHDLPPLEIRTKAKQFASKTIAEQKEMFQSWGIIGDWQNHYATFNSSYVKVQLKIFNKLYKKKLIYRDVKPVYWSPSTRTALAEAELEYNENHKSPSAYVRFKIQKNNLKIDNLYALIWTTTPWTLPSNQAVCYNPALQYSLVKNNDNNYILATDLIESVSKTLNTNFDIVDQFPGTNLSDFSYQHPIYKEKELRFLPSTHATASKGTGLVHTAPAHGPDDFLVALNNKMNIVNIVNDFACYTSEAGADLEGKFVLKEGNEQVVSMLKEDLVHLNEFTHSYPYDWRSKKPVIIRASQQWFIDTNAIKARAVDALEHVKIVPKANGEVFRKHFLNQIQKRPYWCISRQRKWGVPIPVFYNKQEVILNDEIIRHLTELLESHGTDFWWKLPIEQLLPENVRNEVNITDIEKGQDILDIWFDSGISWATALEGDKVADMYLEGVDQFTGWFQSSLITSMAVRDKAPYKTIYVHGFAVDDKGAKMSKSVGNVISPVDIVRGGKSGRKAYGIDTLRWWVACHANQDSVAYVTTNVLQSSADELHKIRSVIRFILGSLNDYQMREVKYEELSLLDKYILHLLYEFHWQTAEKIDNYEFHRICSSVLNLLTNAISSLYFTAVKDRLYCDSLDSDSRRGSQFVLLQIFEIVTQSVAPIVPHLVEEMYFHLPQKNAKSFFMAEHSKPEANWLNEDVNSLMSVILEMKREINKIVGASTVQTVVSVDISPKVADLIRKLNVRDGLEAELEDIFQVAEVKLKETQMEPMFKLDIAKTSKFSCLRCRRMHSDVKDELCERCSEIVNNSNLKSTATN